MIPETATDRALNAFHVGADAVLPKHADTGLLVAQVRALLRHDASRDSRYSFHGFLLDTAAERLQHEGREVDLTPTEFAILTRLAHSANAVVTKATLARWVWGHGHVSSTTVRVHVNSMRRKLRAHRADEIAPIATVRGKGYRLDS